METEHKSEISQIGTTMRDICAEMQYRTPTAKRLIEALVFSILTAEDTLIVGLHGVGKSRAVREMSALFPQGSIFTTNCHERMSAEELLGLPVIEARLKGEDVIKPKGLAVCRLGILEEMLDLPDRTLRDAIIPASDTPVRKVSRGQFEMQPLILDRLHNIWGTSNTYRLNDATMAVLNRILFQIYVAPVMDASGQIAIAEAASLGLPQLKPFEEKQLEAIKKYTAVDNPEIVIPHYILRLKDIILTEISRILFDSESGIKSERFPPCDIRSKQQAIKLLKAGALFEGRTIIQQNDLRVLKYFCLLAEYDTQVMNLIIGLVDNYISLVNAHSGEARQADIILASHELLQKRGLVNLYRRQDKKTEGIFSYIHIPEALRTYGLPRLSDLTLKLNSFTCDSPQLERLRQETVRLAEGQKGELLELEESHYQPKSIKHY